MHKILSHWLSDLDSFDRGWFVHYAKKKTTTQNKKTKQRKREKDQIFILMRSFLSKKDIPVFVYFEK